MQVGFFQQFFILDIRRKNCMLNNMPERKVYDQLFKWKNKPDKMALLVDGTPQAGNSMASISMKAPENRLSHNKLTERNRTMAKYLKLGLFRARLIFNSQFKRTIITRDL